MYQNEMDIQNKTFSLSKASKGQYHLEFTYDSFCEGEFMIGNFSHIQRYQMTEVITNISFEDDSTIIFEKVLIGKNLKFKSESTFSISDENITKYQKKADDTFPFIIRMV